MYKLFRNVLFWFPPEEVHHITMSGLSAINKIPGAGGLFSSSACNHPSLRTHLFGLDFRNPVGLAAGFDKNAKYLSELEMLGFGSIEIGTVTPKAQDGNPKPRLFRLPESQAIINRMGFNNEGVQVIANRLRNWRMRNADKPKPAARGVIIGGNIGKNKLTSNEDAWKDYNACFSELFDSVDYFVVNVSSPNTPGLRALQERDALGKILSHLQTINRQQAMPKPLLLKIAPDLTVEQLDDVLGLAMEIGLDGLVATNTTIDRDGLNEVSKEKVESIGVGGLSGKPLKQRSTSIVKYIHDNTRGSIPIIASGGIFTAEDAMDKLKAGASLVQVWTGFIYEGPFVVNNICKALIGKLPRI